MDFPLNIAELSVSALVVLGAILTMFYAFKHSPAIIGALDTYQGNRAIEQREEDSAERAAIQEANAHSMATITAQTALIDRQQSLLQQAQKFADTLLEGRDDMEAALAGVRGKVEELLPLRGKVEALERQLAESKDTISNLETTIRQQGAEIQRLTKENERLVKALEESEGEKQEMTARLKVLEKDKEDRNGTGPLAEEKPE